MIQQTDSEIYALDDDSTQTVCDEDDGPRRCLPVLLPAVPMSVARISPTFESFLSKHKSETSDIAWS
jgi:hypothetical protein